MRRRHQQLDFAGSIHFVTTVTSVRGNWFATDTICNRILRYFEKYRIKNELLCFGYVLMPDHLHALLYQDNDKTSVPDFMRDLKRETSKRVKILDYPVQKLWCARYDDVPVPGKDSVIVKLRYMLYNPVRRGLVDDPRSYPWSSAKEHYDIGTGIVTVERI